MTLLLRLIDEPAAESIVAGSCPAGWRCAPDYPAEGDRVAAAMFLERCAAGIDPRPFGAYLVWKVTERAYGTTDSEQPGVIIGGIGFHGGMDDRGRVEIGYGIVGSERRKGHATQALRQLIEVARDLGAVTLFAETDPSNEPSQAVLRRVGFSRYGDDEHAVRFELALGCR
ncbi:MAG TPA: GNAT family protein [Frankiaceae bacterium]|nr:GNAT family protein [Frankiaceae bacterium]